MELNEEKKRLRTEIRALLSALPEGAREQAGVEVAEHLAPLLTELAARRPGARVAFFASLPWELGTAPMDRLLTRLGLTRLLPAWEGGSLHFHELDPRVELERLPRDRLGIPAPPPEAPVCAPESLDLILVPGLAFDPSGGRLGQGGGFYDRALASHQGKEGAPRVIGLGFDLQLRGRVPMGPGDRRLDGVCTPTAGLRFTPRD